MRSIISKKTVTFIASAVLMTLVFAMPVMAATYSFAYNAEDSDDNSYLNVVPGTLNAGDVISVSNAGDYPAQHGKDLNIEIQYSGPDGSTWGFEEYNASDAKIISKSGFTSWTVTQKNAAPQNELYDAIYFYLRATDEPTVGDNVEVRHKSLASGTVGRPYSDTLIDFGNDSNINITNFSWNGDYLSQCGLHDNYDEPGPFNGTKIEISGTPRRMTDGIGIYSVEVWYTSTNYPDGHSIRCLVDNSLIISSAEARQEEKEENDDDDKEENDDDDKEEPAPSSGSSQSSWTPAPASAKTTVAQSAATQLSTAQTNLAALSVIPTATKEVYKTVGMDLNMISVNTIDANTTKLIAANSDIPYNVTFLFLGKPMVCKIPAGFNYAQFTRADGTMNIHEVLWAVYSGRWNKTAAKTNTRSTGRR